MQSLKLSTVTLLPFLLTMLSYVVSVEAIAQKDILRQCGSKYQELKAANALNGKNWNEFFLECRNQYSKNSLEQSNSASAQLILSNCAEKYQEQKSYKEHNGKKTKLAKNRDLIYKYIKKTGCCNDCLSERVLV